MEEDISAMDKEDLIYDVVCDIRDKMDKRLSRVECDIEDYKCFKTRVLQTISIFALGIPLVIEALKKKFF